METAGPAGDRDVDVGPAPEQARGEPDALRPAPPRQPWPKPPVEIQRGDCQDSSVRAREQDLEVFCPEVSAREIGRGRGPPQSE